MALSRTLFSAVVLSLALSACQPQAAPVAAPAASPTPSTEAAAPVAAGPVAAPSCPDADFDGFLKRFSADIAVQKKATADPLSMTRVDPDAQPEPKPVTRGVPLAEVEWPVIPNLQASRNGGLDVVVSTGKDGDRQVTVRTPDTDDQQTFRFAQRPCWTLVQVDDESI